MFLKGKKKSKKSKRMPLGKKKDVPIQGTNFFSTYIFTNLGQIKIPDFVINKLQRDKCNFSI